MKIISILCLAFINAIAIAQVSPAKADYDREIQFHLNKSKILKTAGWITLAGGYVATGVATAIASNAQTQVIILIGGFGGVAVATYLLQFKASANKNHAKLIEIERDILFANGETEREKIFQEAALHFKNKAVANRIPAIILSAVGGISIIGVLTTPSGTQDPFAAIAIGGGLVYVAASLPFYIRAAQLTKISKSLKKGHLPRHRFREFSPTISTNGNSLTLGLRVGL